MTGHHRTAGDDVVADELQLLLVAINPSTRSAALAAPFFSPGNPFWSLLHASGLTPVLLEPPQAHRLVEYGTGLTTTVRRPTPGAASLTAGELRTGATRVRDVVRRTRPRVVALLGLTLYPLFFPDAPSPGPGLKTGTLEGASVFVLPNPSGRNRAYPGFSPKLEWYEALARFLAPTR